jgi:hypothetical protein
VCGEDWNGHRRFIRKQAIIARESFLSGRQTCRSHNHCLQALRAIRVRQDGIRARQLLLMLCAAAVVLNEKWDWLSDVEKIVSAHGHRLPRAHVSIWRDEPAWLRPSNVGSSRPHGVGFRDDIV